jgi:hypothetical protein
MAAIEIVERDILGMANSHDVDRKAGPRLTLSMGSDAASVKPDGHSCYRNARMSP